MNQQQKRQAQFSGAYLFLALAALLVVQGVIARRTAPKVVPMSELVELVKQGKIAEAQVRETEIVAELKPDGEAKPQRVVATRLPGVEGNALVADLLAQGAKLSGYVERTSWLEAFLLTWLLPIALLGAIWFFLMRRLQGGRGGPLSIGRNKARIYDASQAGRVTF
ncbi:MAG TPA: ATP-dependent metallopeptidase FtsH/Yme1/Tma family protein, partial [Vicinamibacteria bacterium]|nr:ATP-dependent metallopeptidase FtsH/Yme1/Tma family protein [Vicinamibacteria bacterium]